MWQTRRKQFHEIPPTIVKKMIAGKGNASKAEVAVGLARFIGERWFDSDDQSDAVAVGITWIQLNKDCEVKHAESTFDGNSG